MPIKNDGSLEEQSKRLLKYLQITKFGMIALQSAFEKIGIKTPADGTQQAGRYQIRRFTQFEAEMVDVEVGGRIIVYTQFSIAEDDPPFRVALDPPIGNLNQLLAIKINFMIGQAFKELPDMCDNNLVHIRGPASNLYAAYSDLN